MGSKAPMGSGRMPDSLANNYRALTAPEPLPAYDPLASLAKISAAVTALLGALYLLVTYG